MALEFPIELEMLIFFGGRKTGEPVEKPLEQGENQQQHMTLGLGFEPGPHWWEACALTTAPTLLLSMLKSSK